ncbi:dermonecrotic toxin domain-containing protein [Pseudomonas sp. Z3-8]|uniref:dermonecrotic toxin domain-containing protein n=1 Tax=Pseudomonas sp. Z3-8 TaxID=2817412 RepID=UPI003DA90D38
MPPVLREEPEIASNKSDNQIPHVVDERCLAWRNYGSGPAMGLSFHLHREMPMSVSNAIPSPSLQWPATDVDSLVLSLHGAFTLRPTLREVAQRTLQEVFDDRYPALDISVADAVLVEPRWHLMEGQNLFDGYIRHPLTDLLLECCRSGTARALKPESFLSKSASADHPENVGIPLADIQQILGQWGPLLLECYQQRLVDFWSQPQGSSVSVWRQVSDLLRTQLQQASAGLESEEYATVQAVLDFPDNGQRQDVLGNTATQAFITHVHGTDPDTHRADDVLVLSMTRNVDGREIALLFTLSGGVEVFSSESAMEESWFGRRSPYWELSNYIPEHDIFDALTLCLLEGQLQKIATIEASGFTESKGFERRVAQLSSLSLLLGALRSGHEARRSTLLDLLPPWLKQASSADRATYSRLLSSLATLHRKGTSFMRGIPTIGEFAEQALKAEMLKDDRARADMCISEIKVTLQRMTDTVFEIVDPPYPPSRYVTETQTFPQMAMANLGAFPLAPMHHITYRDGEPPTWLTYDYLRALTTRADIGKHYPELLRYKLLDEREAVSRQRDFCNSLGVLLPLLALELKIKNSLTDLAYRYVVAALQPDVLGRRVEGQDIVVRPLGFLTDADATPDGVMNMFVIGPANVAMGPCILYRPASTAPLMEFSSRMSLFAAIKEQGQLQDSVLAGLSVSVRAIYANGGFDEPHTTRVIFSDFDVILAPEPARLNGIPLRDEVATALYRACAQALIERAKEASVSDVQERWERFRQFAWGTFNLLLPLLDGPLALVGLLVQLTASLDELVESQSWENHSSENQSSENRSQALADVLIGLALALVQGGRQLSDLSRLDELQVAGGETSVPRALIDTAIHTSSTSSVSARPSAAKARLFYGWSSPPGRFSARELVRLDTFKLEAFSAVQGYVASGEYRGLYQLGSEWYASVEGDWYRVSPREEGVVIIDTAHPARTGPWLENDGQGRWCFSYGPRLLGGAGGLSASARKKLKGLEKKARELLATLSQSQAEARRLSTGNSPSIDVQDMFLNKAGELDRHALDMAQLTQPLGEQAPQVLIEQLRAGARQLRALGRTTRIAMLKSRRPDVGAVDYLLQERQVSIRRLGERLDCSGGKGRDFLQEYEIRDTVNNRVLWYAHFHYPKQDTAPQDFSKAHLKTAAQRRQGVAFQVSQQQAGQSVERIWRSDIGRQAASRLFLSA